MRRQLAIVLIGLAASAGTVLGDGGMFFRRASYKAADVFQPAQKVYIRWDGSQERLLIQTKYEGPAEEMVWIVPVPSKPTVRRANGSIFNDLSKRTYDLAIDFSDFASLDPYVWNSVGGVGTPASTSPVEWHERIGDYDVALLRPVGGEDVIEWLNANDFAVPEAIHPVLEDYIGNGWWMVTSRIHPDALSAITSEKLAKGTLHPLELTFQSSACVFPMRLTRLAAGPVEELIYIEGPAHYEPAALTDSPWDIKLFGGPIRKVPENYSLRNLEEAVEVREGRTQVEMSPRLTKLRRVLQPSEMTDDIVFREIDLAQWLASKDATPLTLPVTPSVDTRFRWPIQAELALQLANSAPMRIAQAATQYGRWRDPNGVGPLIATLSPEALDKAKPEPADYLAWPSASAKLLSWKGMGKWWRPATEQDWQYSPGCGHMRSCIWALGEIGVEHQIGQAAQDKLLECAQHDNQLIRMEAYIALTKRRSEELGPIVMDRLVRVFSSDPLPILNSWDHAAVESEIDILTDWIVRFGTTEQKDAWIDRLDGLLVNIDVTTIFGEVLKDSSPIPCPSWSDWIPWQASISRDERLVPALQALCSRLSSDKAQRPGPFLLRAAAACGSAEAATDVVRQVLEEARAACEGQTPGTGSLTSLVGVSYKNTYRWSLRQQILRKRGLAYVLYPMPADVSDRTLRLALSNQEISDWDALYLLAGIRRAESCDEERLMQIWNSQDGERPLLTVDVLYAWGDTRMLMDLYDRAECTKVGSEIAWALAALKEKGASIIEEQVRDSWNVDWLSLDRAFIHPLTNRQGQPIASYLTEEMRRVEKALWDYFHPAFGLLDEEQIAALRRIAADRTIHAGMRFDLLGRDYGGTEWGLPLLEQAARDILAIDSSSSTIERIMSMMKSVGNGGFVVETSLE